jgi:hypothetical protein
MTQWFFVKNPSLEMVPLISIYRAITVQVHKTKMPNSLKSATWHLADVGITGLEPATSRPPDVCATNCAKSRSLKRLQRYTLIFISPNICRLFFKIRPFHYLYAVFL